jgi:predicted O-methyltransferase YrrM
MIRYYRYQNVLELGTSLGINTMYLAQDGARTITLEGASDLANLAQQSFAKHGLNNITVVPGNIDDTLPGILEKIGTVDFVFLDANHRYTPTMKYAAQLLPSIVNGGVMVVDDIHRSREMERAWEEIKGHQRIHCTVDLFRCGIAFVGTSLNKQHAVLQY